MSSEEAQLDHPLYGDFEDYLDGKLPPARCQEVTDLLARSAAAREVLEELRTARRWLEGTRWDVPEPARWPSAEDILARAGRRPAALPAALATKPDRAARKAAWWAAGWLPWQWDVRSPAWAWGAAVSLLLLVGSSLWWVLRPAPPDELAQSKASESAEAPSQPAPSVASPDDMARPERPGEIPPVATPSRKKAPGAPASETLSAHERTTPAAAGATGTTNDAGRADAAPPVATAPGQPATLPEQKAGRPLSEAAPPAREELTAEAELARRRREARPLAAAPPAEADALAGQPSGAETRDKGHDGNAKESRVAQPSPVASAQKPAPVAASVLRLVVANRRAALTQMATVAREFGGTVQVVGEQVVVRVPAARVAECIARLRARVAVVTEGEMLQVTVRARE